jgi:hypothetical protein
LWGEAGYEALAKRTLVALFGVLNYFGNVDDAGAMMSVDEMLLYCSRWLFVSFTFSFLSSPLPWLLQSSHIFGLSNLCIGLYIMIIILALFLLPRISSVTDFRSSYFTFAYSVFSAVTSLVLVLAPHLTQILYAVEKRTSMSYDGRNGKARVHEERELRISQEVRGAIVYRQKTHSHKDMLGDGMKR